MRFCKSRVVAIGSPDEYRPAGDAETSGVSANINTLLTRFCASAPCFTSQVPSRPAYRSIANCSRRLEDVRRCGAGIGSRAGVVLVLANRHDLRAPRIDDLIEAHVWLRRKSQRKWAKTQADKGKAAAVNCWPARPPGRPKECRKQ